MEPPFESVQGVLDVKSGYAGGSSSDANYEKVSSGQTKHREVVQITFDPKKVSYEDLLAIFWRNIDPFDDKGQFCDKGFQYTSAIYALNDGQRAAALKALEQRRSKWKQQITTQIEPAAKFFEAEEYHQDYHRKNPVRYKLYRTSCGRDARLKQISAQ